MSARAPAQLESTDDLRSRSVTIRGQKVILDADLAMLYGVTTKNLNKAVKRNRRRFPRDFLFQLTPAEVAGLRFQNGTAKSCARGGTRYLPYAFTENGAVMAANVLRSPQAVRLSVFVVRAFIQRRDLLSSNSRELATELRTLETKLTSRLDEHEIMIIDVLRRIMDLIDPPPLPPLEGKSMGYHTTLQRPAR